MSSELRCEHKKFGDLLEDGTLEVKCRSVFCGYQPGVVVIHTFDVQTGQLVGTSRYREPGFPERG